MNCIDAHNPVPWDVQSKEFVFTVAGGIVFAVSILALSYFLISSPTVFNLHNTVCYTLLCASIAAGFVTFVVGLYFYHRKRKEDLENVIADLESAQPIEIEEVELEETEFTTLDYIENVRKVLPPLLDAIGEFLQSFVIGYYKCENKTASDLTTIPAAFELVKKQIDAFLQNPQEVLRVAIGIAAYSKINQDKMGQLLLKADKSVQQFIEGLAETLEGVGPGFESKQRSLLKQILQVLSNQAVEQSLITDGVLRSNIAALRTAHAAMVAASGEEEKMVTAGAYQTALCAVVDYLYMNAEIPQQRINTWTAHLIPSFLENWRSSLFQTLSASMTDLCNAFGPKGKFNEWGFAMTLKAGRAFPKAACEQIKGYVDVLPLIAERKDELQKAVEMLFPVIIDSFIAGTVEQSHPLRAKIQGILGQQLKLPVVQEKSWQAYITAYAAFF